MKMDLRRAAWKMVALLAVCLCLVLLMGTLMTRQYRLTNANGSAAHLTEVNRQGRITIETFMARDQNVARQLARELDADGIAGETDLFALLAATRVNWGEDGVCVYTADGRCFDDSGARRQSSDIAATAQQAVSAGETFRIVRAQMEYAVRTGSALTVDGARVVAVSVVHDLDNLIDSMGLVSFGGAGRIYLTRQNGIKICQSGTGNIKTGYNLLASFADGKVTDLGAANKTIAEAMQQNAEGAFLYTPADGETLYVIATPLSFLGQQLYLFNVVPAGIVNSNSDVYSRNIMVLSAAVVLLTVLLFVLFFLSYRRRELAYYEELHSRERLFDLLVGETRNAYLLLEEGRPQPTYVSSNMTEILQERIGGICRSGSGYRLLAAGENAQGGPALARINADLAHWDGTQEYVSDFLPYVMEGEQRYLRLRLYPVAARAGEFIGIAQDMTEEYRSEQSLRDAFALADSANRAKTQFLSSVSHDIRTPLNAIINMARFLRRSVGDNPRAQEEVEVIQQSSDHLLELINNVLDLSRIESGKLSFASTPFDLEHVMAELCEMLQPLCSARQQTFLYTQQPFAHARLVGDPLRLSQILLNILNNAVKFTPEGGSIRFSVTELPMLAGGEVPFRFAVRDSGIGIPADKLEAIFEPFTRGEGETVRRAEGSGLGLAIAKRFVDALGGTISVQSTVGSGTEFIVELTYAADTAGAPQEAASECGAEPMTRMDGVRVLLAEDNAINTEIACALLGEWGVAVETAADGQQAVDRFAASAVGYYDLVYMDIQMPVLDGYGATAGIRALPRPDAAVVPIIAMTANAFAEDVEKARAAGMNAHIAKPVDPQQLHRVTRQLLAQHPKPAQR